MGVYIHIQLNDWKETHQNINKGYLWEAFLYLIVSLLNILVFQQQTRSNLHYLKNNVNCTSEESAKGYMLYDYVYLTFWKRRNYKDRKQVSGCQEPGGRLGRGSTKGQGEILKW